MAAVVSSSSLGLLNSSLYVLGSQGALGQATQGRSGEQVFVNGSSGNLVIQNRDELVIGRGPDLSLLRTYNSQGLFDGDNNDNWRFGVYRKVYNLTGTVNTAGSTVTRVAEDGSESLYTFDVSLGKYVCHDGGGSFDTLTFTSVTQTWTWSWTDGTNQLTELYDAANDGRITSVTGQAVRDQDSNGLTFTYNAAGLIIQVTDANGESTFLDYSGTDLTQLRTVTSGGQTIIRTRYAYDASHRLTTVTTDLSPEDASVTDGKTYVVNYTYDDTNGPSKRVATLAQSDGTRLTFAYVQTGTDFKVSSITDALGQVTSFSYGTAATTTTVNANPAALTTPTVGWAGASLLETSTTAASQPSVGFDAAGNAMAVWVQGTDVLASRYTKSTGTWSAVTVLDENNNAISALQLYVDASGNAIASWVQSDGAAPSTYQNRYRFGAWIGTQTVESAAGLVAQPAGSINANGDSAMVWRQANATGGQDLYANRRPLGIGWTGAVLIETGAGVVGTPAVAIDAQGNIQAVWQQNDGTVDSIYSSRYTAATGWSAPVLLESSADPASLPRIGFDGAGNALVVWVQGADVVARTWTQSTGVWSAASVLDSNANAISALNVGFDASGNAIATWVQSDGVAASVYANRYVTGVWTGAQLLESAAGITNEPTASINAAGNAVVVWRQTNGTVEDLFASRFTGGAWTAAQSIEAGAANVATPAVAIDAQGNIQALWQQSDGAAASIYANRYVADATPYYTVQGQSWAAVAQAVYGTAAAAGALQAAVGNPALTPGVRIAAPASLTYSTVTAPANTTGLPTSDTQTTTQIFNANTAALTPQTGNPNPLPNWVPVTNLSAAAGTWLVYQLEVPVGQTELFVSTSGGTGNANLYVRRGAAPTTTLFDASSTGTSNTESVRIANPAAGTWYVGVLASAAFSGMRLEGHYQSGTAGTTILQPGQAVSDLYGKANNTRNFSFEIPAGTTSFRLTLSGSGAGEDADLYMAYNAPVNLGAPGFWSEGPAVDETITVNAPSAGTWNVVMKTWSSSLSDATLLLQTDLGANTAPTVQGGAPQRALPGALVSLTATASDAQGAVSYQWTQLRGPAVTLTNAATATASFTAPNAPGPTTLDFQVRVTDSNGASITDIVHVLVDAPTLGYVVPLNPTWATVASAIYGSAAVATQLQTALGNPALTQNAVLKNLPATLSNSTTATVTVAPYYTVQAGNTWTTIAQAVYGTSDPGAAEALRDALGNPALTTGTKLTMPQSLTYSVPGSQGTGSGRTLDVTDALGKVTTMVTNALGQLTQILNPAVGGVRQSVSYTYNANGDVTQVTDARGLVTTYDYDANGNRKLERDAVGNTITRVFGSKNELQTETSYVVPDPDGAGAGQPGTPLTTRYVYDANAHLRFAISAEGRVTEYRYNTFGQRVAAIQYTGQYTGALYDVSTLAPTQTPTETQLVSFVNAADKTRTERIDSTYDFRGQLQTTTSYGKVDAAGVGVNDSDKAVTNYVYDQTGNLTNTVDGRGSSTAYVYDGLGRLTKTTDAAGHPPITTFYDDVNKKTVLTSANGLVTTSTYDAKGELISVLQSVGVQGLGTTSFFYDADGRLRRTVDPTVPTGISTHILYDEAGRRIATIDGTGTLTEYRYDADNNLTRSIQYATAVSAANLASLTDALGNPTSVALAAIRPAASGQDRSSWNAYDSANRLVKSVDELGYITQYFYDGVGRLTDVLRSAKAMTSTAALGDTPTAASIAPAATDPLDRRTRNFYDADGKLRGTLDGEGYLVEYKYDAAGQLVESVGYSKVTDPSPTLRVTGTLAQLIPTENASELQNDIHSYTLYNAKGQVIGTVDAEGFLTESVYDAAGNKKQVIRYATKVVYSAGVTLGTLRPAIPNVQDRTSNFTYTALNQLASASDFEGTTTNYTYDEVGNLTQSVKAVGTSDARTSSAQYDKQGRLIAQMDGKGSPLLIPGQTQAQIDAVFAANGTRYNYDASGRRTSSIDANGNKTLYYYDADGHLTHTINAVGEVTESKYNVLGQLSQTIAYGTRIDVGILGTPAGGLANTTLTNAITGPTGIANASLDSVTTYSYTARGQVASSADPLQFATTNTYDAFGDLTVSSQQIGAGATRDHTYDFDRRGLLTRTVWDPSFVNASELRQYDAFGRVTQTTDANGNVRTRGYDRLGRTVSTTLDPGAGHLAIGASTTYDAFDRVLTQTDALGNSTSFVYSTANRSVTMTTPEGIGMTTVHNRQGETQSVTDGRGNITKYDYDQDGMLKQVTLINAQGQTVSTTTSIYDKADRLTDTVDANGNTVHFTYDAANRVLTRVVDPGAGHLNLTTTYEYDAKGQKTKVTDANNTVTQTVFDLKGQVTSVIVDPGTGHLNLTTTYSYVGKKTLTVTEGVGGTNPPKVTKYTYDNLGRRTQEQVDPSGLNLTTTYTYDKNGNVVSKTEAAGKPEARTTRYVYDAADRLVWTIDALGDVTKNEYNAEGRVTRSIGYANALVNFATLPASPTAGDVTSRLTLAAGDQADSHVYDKDGREVYTIDALGDVRQRVYDAAGNVIQSTAYANPISVPASPTPTSVAGLVAAANPNTQLNQTTRTVYDAAGRAVSVTHAQGTSAEYTETNAYDGVGNVIRHTDGRGNSEWFAFDRADRRTRHIDALGFVTGFTYDNAGRLQTQTSYMNAVALPTIPDDRYAYNAPNPVPNPDTVSGDRTTRYTYDRAGRLISELNSVGVTNAYAPQQLQANSNQFAQRPVVAYAADGSGFMAWVESDGTRNNVYVNRFVVGSGWQGATLVESDNVGSAVASVQLAVDAAGDAVVVWEHSEPSLGVNLWANYYVNGQGWQGAQRIEAAGGSASLSKVVIDAAGNATAIWTEGSPATFWSNRYVRGQGWQTAQTIAAGIQYQIAGDAAGNVSVIWRGSGGVVGVWLTQYVAGQGWLPATQIASIVNPNSAPSAPSIATDAAGNSVIAWDQTDANGVDNIYVRRFIVGQGWQAIEIVGTHPGPPLGLDVSLSASGAALVTWSVAFASDSFVADIWSAYYLPGQGWQAPAPMNASSALTPMGVQNGIDTGGNAFVAWVEKAGSDVISFTPSQVWIRRYLAGKGWQAAVQVGQTSAATFKVNLAADMNAAGNVLVSWDGYIDTSETQRRIFAYRIGSSGVETRYQYDALGNVTDKIEAAGLAEQRTTHTAYDAAGRLLEQTTALGLPEAATSRFGYDALGDQTSYLDPRGVDLSERDTAWALAERQRLGYVVGTSAKLASQLTAAEKTSLRALYTTTQAFDRLGRQISATDPLPLGNTTRTDYDAFGNIVRAIDPKGNTGYFYYDQRNLLVAQVDPEGNLIEHVYDSAGKETQTIRYATPVSVPYDPSRPLASIRPKGLSLPGTSGSYAVTPDSAANSVTGDIDMRVQLTHDSWAPALAETFITKDDLATNRDYGFRFNSGSTGKLQFVGSPDGVTTFPNADNVTGGYSVVSTAATGFAPGSTHWVRVTRSATTGQIKFYTSDDYDASTNTGTWTQLGDTIAAPTGPIHDGAQTSVLQVGSRIGPAGSDNPLKGTIYYADVRKVIDGTGAAVVAKFDPSADAGSAGAASFTSSSSTHETWTLSGTAAIVAGNPQDEITKTSYDALGRVTRIVDAEGRTEFFGYDRDSSNVNFHQDKNGNVTTYEYDAVGNKRTERLPISSTLSDLGWQGAQSVETTNNFVFLPQIASDAQGNATVIWLQGDATGQALYANRYSAATRTWQGPQVIATSSTGIAPEVALDAQGNAIAVWEQLDGIYAARYLASTGTWQATQRLSTSMGAKPQIVIDAQGNATAIWQQSNGLVNNIYANRYVAATGTWQGAQLIESNDANSANFPQLAVDSNGNAIAVWQQGGIQANRYVAATGTWQGAQFLGAGEEPHVAFDAQGNAVAVWILTDGTRYNIRANRYVAATATWQGAQLIETNDSGNAFEPRVALDTKGNAIAVWQHFDGIRYSIYANRYAAATGTWQGAQLLETDDRGSATAPQIAFDAQDNATVVWTQFDGIRSSIYANRYITAAGAWQGVQLLETNDARDAFSPQVAVSAQGTAFALWDQSSDIFVNRYDFTQIQVVNRYEYDALGNKTKEILAQGLPEQRVTQYVYDKNDRLTETIEPQVLTQQTSAPAASGVLQAAPAGIATYKFAQSTALTPTNTPPATLTPRTTVSSNVTVSWPPIIGYGDGKVRVVWKTGSSLGDFTQTTSNSTDTSLTLGVSAVVFSSPASNVSNRLLTADQVYEVYIYKQTSLGDVLIASVNGNYGWTGVPAVGQTRNWNASANNSLVPPTLSFSGQPLGQSMHVAYWPDSDPTNVTEVDLKSYSAGTYSGMVPGFLSGGYGFEAKVFSASGATLSSFTGTFLLVNGVTSLHPQSFVSGSGALQTPHELKAYDAAGNLIRETDAKGFVTFHYYDANNRLIGTVDAERYLHRFFYDGAGNLVTEQTYEDRVPGGDLSVLPSAAGMTNYRETTYRYDANNLLLQSATQAVLVFDPISHQVRPPQALVRQRQYDRNGNVIVETDANGNNTYSYYDKAGRKVASVDAMNYLTTWAYDAMGNIVRQVRYAAQLSGAISAASDPALLAAQAAAANNPDDRICLYAYDRMNRLIQETTLQVAVATVAATDGSLTEQPTNVVVRKRYDGNGNLIAQIQDAAETDYAYDGLNRQIQELAPIFTDFAGLTVRGTKTTAYDGVGNTRLVLDHGSKTIYEYDAHGDLTREIDPLGNERGFSYDLNSNITLKHTKETNPDGTVVGFDAVYEYDNLNRLTKSTEARNLTYFSRYDAFGEIVAKGLNGVEREFDEYDKAGRLIRTNKDDGVYRVYLYDANGNATAKIQSAGGADAAASGDIDLSPGSGPGHRTVDQIAALPANALERTESVYDARNQLVETRQPLELAPAGTWVEALGDPFLGGTVTGMQGGTATYNIHEQRGSTSNTLSGVEVSWPPIVGYGDGNIKIVWNTGNTFLGASGVFTYFFNTDATSAHLTGAQGEVHGFLRDIQALPATYSISIYKQTFAGDVLMTTVSGSGTGLLFPDIPPNDIRSTTVSSTVESILHFTGQRPEAQSARLWLWPVGGTKTEVPVSRPTTVDGTQIPGDFIFDWSNSTQYPPGLYNYEFQTFDGTGGLLDYVKGTMNLGETWSGAQLIETDDRNNAFDPQIAYDAQGNAMAVWCQSDGIRSNIYVNRYVAASGTWQGAQLLEASDFNADTLPQIAFDPQGNATAVWSQFDGVRYNIYANRYVAATGTWQGAQLIDNVGSGSATEPRIAFDTQGNAMAVWYQFDGVRYNVYANRYVAATGSWQGAQLIETDDRGHAVNPRIAFDAQGNAMAVWQQFDGVRYNIYANRYVASTGTWQGAQLIETDDRDSAGGPKIVFDAQGNAIAVWSQSDGARFNIYANRYVAATGIWQGVQLIETDDRGSAGPVQIASDAQGNAMAVWYQFDGTRSNIYANRYVAATGTWQGVQLIETNDSGNALNPQIGLDAQGNAMAVWQQSDGTRINIYANRYVAATGTWQGVQLLETDDRGSAQSPQVAFDARGNAIVVWYQSDGTRQNIYANRLAVTGVVTKQVQTMPVDTTIVRKQAYNAFGEVMWQRDGVSLATLGANADRNNATMFKYNTRGDLIEKSDPLTSITLGGSGSRLSINPTTRYYYDYLGRAVGVHEPNRFLSPFFKPNTERYDGAGNLVAEYHADGGRKLYGYDASGNLRTADTETSFGVFERTTYTYDAKNQLIRIDHPTGANFFDANHPNPTDPLFSNVARFDRYDYDEAGRRIRHIDALGNMELTYYDSIGRVRQTTSAGGVVRTYRYLYNPLTGETTTVTQEGEGRSLDGGIVLIVFNQIVAVGHADGDARSLTDTRDYFGRLVKHNDLGGHAFTYTYNNAGWLVRQVGDTDLTKVGTEQDIAFTYYRNGFLKGEIDNTLKTLSRYRYDQSGNRIFEGYTRTGNSGQLYYENSKVQYDALNRVTGIVDPTHTINYEYDPNGNRQRIQTTYSNGLSGGKPPLDYWYEYDAMNRFTRVQGSMTPGFGISEGTEITYDLAGRRNTAMYVSNDKLVQECYTYTDGLLTTTTIFNWNAAGSPFIVGSTVRKYDAAGNVIDYQELNGGGGVTRDIRKTYTGDHAVKTETGPNGTSTSFYDAVGNLRRVLNPQPGGTKVSTFYAYEFWDSAKQSQIQIGAENRQAPNWQPGFSHFTYDVNGHLAQVRDDAADRTLSYKLDAEGRILQRDELFGNHAEKSQYYYYSNGVAVGDAGTAGPSATDYAAVLASRSAPAPDRSKPVVSADFGNYMPINDSFPATAPGSYTIRDGDIADSVESTLANVARAIWGDGTLWYLLEDANGLKHDSVLAVGQTLVIPNVVSNVHNSSSTFKVYNPNEQLGDISPTLPDPPPPPQEDCDVAGIIFVALVVVVVTIITDGALTEAAWALGSELLAAAAYPIAVAAGNAAGQEAAKSVGLREHFSFREVGAAFLASWLPNIPGVPAAVNAVAQEAAAQQIRRGMHVQSGFDWGALAAAPIAQAAGDEAAGLLPKGPEYAALRGLVSGAVRSVVSQRVSILLNDKGKIQWGSVAQSALSGAYAGARAGQEAKTLERANLQDYYRDMEGSPILSDSSPFAKNITGDIGELGTGKPIPPSAALDGLNGAPNNGNSTYSGTGGVGGTMRVADTGDDGTWSGSAGGFADEPSDRLFLTSPDSSRFADEDDASARANKLKDLQEGENALRKIEEMRRALDAQRAGMPSLGQGLQQYTGPRLRMSDDDGFGFTIPLSPTAVQIGTGVGRGLENLLLAGFEPIGEVADMVQGGLKALHTQVTGRAYDLSPLSLMGGQLEASGGGTIEGLKIAAYNTASIFPPVAVWQASTGLGSAIYSGDVAGIAESAVGLGAGLAGARAAGFNRYGIAIEDVGYGFGQRGAVGLRFYEIEAQDIAGGHAFEKHVLGVGNETGAEFGGLGIRTRQQFAEHLESVMDNPTHYETLGDGRAYYYDLTTNTVVIRNPNASDGGTGFRVNLQKWPNPLDYLKTLR